MNDYITGKNKNDILKEMSGPMPGSVAHEQQKAAIIVRCTEDIEVSLHSLSKELKESSESNEKLSVRVFWLNLILTLATVVGAVATVGQWLK